MRDAQLVDFQPYVCRTNCSSTRLFQILKDDDAPQEARQLIAQLLVYNPEGRLPYQQILAHAYFDELRKDPPPHRTNGRPIPALQYVAKEPSSEESTPNAA